MFESIHRKPGLAANQDSRRQLEASGQRLEACAFVQGVRSFLVLVYRVEYGDEPEPTEPRGVVRFSEREHSIQVSRSIKLSSPQFYRELEECSASPGEQEPPQTRRRGRRRAHESGRPRIRDEMEARYEKKYSLEEFHSKFRPELANAPVPGSARLTYGTSGFWILCTSVEPDSSRDYERLWKAFPQYDCAIIIANPSEFALQLGKDFGSQYGEDAIHTNAIGILRQAKIAQPFIETGAPVPDAVVTVRHGQVVYDDEPASIIERYPPQFQGMVLPFVKRRTFADQKEYRFTVSLGGEPKRQRICVGVSDELRSLVHSRPRE